MKNKIALVILLLVTFFHPARGAEISLVTLDRSWHYFDKGNKFNERHRGLGLQLKVNDTEYAVVGYTNSLYDDSVLLTATSSSGLVLGLATGYSIPVVPFFGYQVTLFKVFRVTFTPIVAYTQFVIPLR